MKSDELLYDGSHWCFLCFGPAGSAQEASLKFLFAQIEEATGKRIVAQRHRFPENIFWNRRECVAWFVPKAQVDEANLVEAVNREPPGEIVGLSCSFRSPAKSLMFFALGLTSEEFADYPNAGLFGERRKKGAG